MANAMNAKSIMPSPNAGDPVKGEKFPRRKSVCRLECIMIYELEDVEKVRDLFKDWEETLIYSCLQKIMGKIYVTDVGHPKSAYAFVGCFVFYAGVPDRELVLSKPDGFVIMIPQNEDWALLIEECYPTAKKTTRYAIRKDTVFDEKKLQAMMDSLPSGYTLHEIDGRIYDKCLSSPATADFVSCFESKSDYLKKGLGMVVLKDGEIVSGASSYTCYEQGIEIEVDTVESERRKHLATAVCSALILKCLSLGLYPSWDAQNMNSLYLAQKLGYVFSHEYIVYEVSA